MKTQREIKQALKDREWWQKLEVIPGWKLYGWTYRSSAAFITGPNSTIQIRGHERNAILTAIEGRER